MKVRARRISEFPHPRVFQRFNTRVTWMVSFVFAVWFVSEIRVKMALSKCRKELEENAIRKTTSASCPICVMHPPPIVETVTPSGNNITCPTFAPESKKFDYADVECYRFASKNSSSIEFLEELTQSSRQPTKGNTIFFTETSCAGNGTVHLEPR